MPPPENREAPARQTGATPQESDNQTDTHRVSEPADKRIAKVAFNGLLADLRNDNRPVEDAGDGRAIAQCPAHNDAGMSLRLTAIESQVLLHCAVGCGDEKILAALGRKLEHLYDAGISGAFYRYPDGRIVQRMAYLDGKGKKVFKQSGNRSGNALFRSDEIADAQLVYFCEGEKDVLAVLAARGAAVSSAMGAGKAHLADLTVLAGKDVIIVVDRDEPGHDHARQAAQILDGVAASVRLVQARTGKDAADHIAAGYGLDEFDDFDEDDPAYQVNNGGYDDDTDTAGQAPRRKFIGRDGLRVVDLAKAVIAAVPIGFNDLNKQFYTYRNGVWIPGNDPIESKIVELLGNKHRDAHVGSTLTVIRHQPQTARITGDPLPDYINVFNGMVDWKTGMLHDHSPKFLSTVQLPVEYDPDADCPVFEQFISEVLPADCHEPCDGGPGFIWELIGYVLHSGNPHHIAVLLYGKGRNGKGTLIRLVKALLGECNMSAVGLHDLVENRFRAATLYGKLANLAGDLDARWISNTAAFKAITGGDPVQAEHKYGHPFEFTPWALPLYSANKAFGSADSSEGWTARWVVVPFPNCFLGCEDRDLDAKLQTEYELRGVLRRGIAALPALMARGRLPVPASVAAAKAEFVSASDAVRSWVGEACVIEVDTWTPRAELYNAYSRHTIFDGSKRLSAREFYNRIDQIGGVVAHKKHGDRLFGGIRLKTTAEKKTDESGADADTEPAPRKDGDDQDDSAAGADGAGSFYSCTRTRGGKGSEPAPLAPDSASAQVVAAAEDTGPRCRYCDDPLTEPASIRCGVCEECRRFPPSK